MRNLKKLTALFFFSFSCATYAADPQLPEGYDCLVEIVALTKPLGNLPSLTICDVELKAYRIGGAHGLCFSVLVPGADLHVGQHLACKNLAEKNITKLTKIFTTEGVNVEEDQDPEERRAKHRKILALIDKDLAERKGFEAELKYANASYADYIVVSDMSQSQHVGIPVQLVGRIVLEPQKKIPAGANILFSTGMTHPIFEGEFLKLNDEED